MSPHQLQAMHLLDADTRRDLYESAARDGKSGNGNFWITHAADEKYAPWTSRDVDELLRQGLIVEKWQGCYTTPRNLEAHPVKGPKS